MANTHGVVTRAAGDFSNTGHFGFLFPQLARRADAVLPFDSSGLTIPSLNAALQQLGTEMLDNSDPAFDGNEPAGYTFFGQFLDHDLTLELRSRLEVRANISALENFRSPGINLDSVYGHGPEVSPFLYDTTPVLPGVPASARCKFLLGQNSVAPDPFGDLPRNTQNTAIIPDPRNDENLAVAQLHLAFLRFHNAVVDRLVAQGMPAEILFSEAERLVRWHYQWIVLHDFLPRIVRTDAIQQALASETYWDPETEFPYIPLEFSAAAYRFGHSLVRHEYTVNTKNFPHQGLDQLFSFTHTAVPNNWIVEWFNFFPLPGQPAPQNGRQIDARISAPLHQAGGGQGGNFDLAGRNLQRGYALGLPSGQAVASELGLNVLTAAELQQNHQGNAFATAPILLQRTPLWFYVLKESEIREGGARLGEVGSHIVANVLVALLQNDSASFLANAPDWQPTLPAATVGQFTMSDLIAIAGQPTIG